MILENIKYCHITGTENSSFVYDHVHITWDKQIRLHRQDYWEIAYIITGRGTRVIGDVMESFTEGEVILIPPHIPHCWSFDERIHDDEGKIENICIFFSSDFLKKSKDVFSELTVIISKIQEYKNAISFQGQTLMEVQKILRDMIVESQVERLSSVIKILTLISSSETKVVGHPVVEDKKSKKMQILNLYVMNNYQNPITLDEVAKFIGMEKSSFCVFFKKVTGQSFFTFLTEYRIEASCKMLLNTTLSVAEVCNACGFGDVPYYNRVFKKMKGITPTLFRNNKAELR